MQFVCIIPYLLNICRKFEFLISQGSVATRLRWGGHCRMNFVANFIGFSAVQKFWKNRLRFDKVTESLKVGTFFETQCISEDIITKLYFVHNSSHKRWMSNKSNINNNMHISYPAVWSYNFRGGICHSLERTQADPLYLSEKLISLHTCH